MGLVEASPDAARVSVYAGEGDPGAWLARVERGDVVILEGDSPLARALGIAPASGRIRVRQIRDARNEKLRIEWQEALDVPLYRVPGSARVFVTDRRGQAPLVAGIRRGAGAVLWSAVSPGSEGYERLPYIPQMLADLGLEPPLASRRLWAFFDDGVHGPMPDPDRVAAEWRRSGIAAVHVAAWNNFEAGEENDACLRRLIEACHRHLIQVYAWLELPHVSQKFWNEHPQWREKTAKLQDARVDWRLLMNLTDPACAAQVRRGVAALISRFDWDGVNLAELYFDGIEGLRNRREFTPLNDYVRRAFREAQGFDPYEIFLHPGDPARERAFFDYRIELSARLEEDWIRSLEAMRDQKPSLDIVLTHVDDLFDTSMRDALGADASRAAKLLEHHQITLVIEDPATLWHLGPRRYAEISRRYAALPARMERVGVDINVVPRQGRVFPTATQTGAEMLDLIHTASESFARVMYYCESTVEREDLPFLAGASAVVTSWKESGGRLEIESPHGIGVRWNGPASVDGSAWPVQDGSFVWIPPGRHTVEGAAAAPAVLVSDFNGILESARVMPDGIELAYRSGARAYAALNRKPERMAIDGNPAGVEGGIGPDGRFIAGLPQGRHRILLRFTAGGR